MNWKFAVLGLSLLILLSGCSSTKQARNVGKSGFLAVIYPEMRKGKGDEPLYYYEDPKAGDLYEKGYFTKILLDPVFVYRGKEARMKGVTQEEAQLAVDRFYSYIYESLDKDYTMVVKPDTGVLRIQIAIVHLDESNPTLDVVSSIPIPYNPLQVSSAVMDISTGRPLFKGEASIEFKISDGKTGSLIAAGIDRRVGGNALNAETFSSWADVNRAFKYWAEMTRYRLCVSRGDTDCVYPEE